MAPNVYRMPGKWPCYLSGALLGLRALAWWRIMLRQAATHMSPGQGILRQNPQNTRSAFNLPGSEVMRLTMVPAQLIQKLNTQGAKQMTGTEIAICSHFSDLVAAHCENTTIKKTKHGAFYQKNTKI